MATRTEEPLYEVVNGQRVDLPPMAISSNLVAFMLGRNLENCVTAKGLVQQLGNQVS
jgi:hypothetical protein